MSRIKEDVMKGVSYKRQSCNLNKMKINGPNEYASKTFDYSNRLNAVN